MSLNHKRRIFRSGAGSLHAMPSLGVLLAAAGGAATVIVTASLFIGPSEAPARVPANSHLSADAGQLAVIDGDTLRVGDHVVRLAGIVAAARGSVCHAGATEVDCGTEAANALAALVRGGGVVDCTIGGHDGAGRPEGDCVSGDVRLSEALVLGGWARADSAGLREAEAAARSAGRGIWRAGS